MDKVITVRNKRFKLSPLSSEEFKLFHGGTDKDFDAFKMIHDLKEVRDFSEEDLRHAYVSLYDGDTEFGWDGHNWVIVNSDGVKGVA